MRFSNLLRSFTLIATSFLFLTSCDKEESTVINPGDTQTGGSGGTTQIYWTPMQATNWAFQEYRNVPIAYIATDVYDPQFGYVASDGYTLKLESTSMVNAAGYPIYVVLGYFPQVTQTTSQNESQDIEFNLRIKGSKNLKGEDVPSNYSYSFVIKRYLCPETNPELLAKDWYLVISTDFAFNQWKSNYSEEKTNGFVSDTATYPFDKTPIIFDASYDNNQWSLSYSNSYNTLMGWLDNSSNVEVPLELKNGFLDTSASVLPAVYFIDKTELRCMVPVYDTNGHLSKIQNYIFGQYTK